MADRTVTTRLKLGVTDWKAGASAVKRDLKDLNKQFAESSGFAAGFRKKLEDATKRLPKIEIDADSTLAEVAMAKLRGELEKLSQKTIGVDIDAGDAFTEMARIKSELAGLEGGASFEVRAGIDQAMRDLGLVEAEVARLDGRNVHLDIDTSAAMAGLGTLAKGAGEVGGALSGAMGVLGKAGPANVAIAAAAIAALPTVASIAATGIVFALGAGLAAVGVTAAAGADKVRDAWSQLGDNLKRELADVAEPFEGSLVRAADVAQRTFERLKPTLARIFTDLVPDVDHFIQKVGDGIVSLGPSLERLSGSFGTMMRELGDRMPQIMDHLSAAFDTFSQMVDDDPQMLANLVEDATELLEVGAKVLSWADEIQLAFSAPFGPAGSQAGTDYFFKQMFGGTLEEILAGKEEFGTLIAQMNVDASKGAQAIQAMGSSSGTAANEVRSLNDALEEFFQPAQSVLAATNDWKDALGQATGALDKGNVSTNLRNKYLEEMLATLAKKAQAERDATGATNDSSKAFETNIGTLVRLAAGTKEGTGALDGLAQSLGFTIDRIGNATIVTDKFGNRVRVLPNGKVVTISAATSAADKRLDSTKGKVDALKDKTVTITVRTEQQEFAAKISQQKKKATGGIDRYATGGIDYAAASGMQLRPQPPGVVSKPTVLFGEGSSGTGASEAFIPYESKYRKRAVDLLSQVADDFGLEVYSRNAANRMSDAGMTIDATGMQVSTGLDAAMGVITGALGEAGTLTSAIDQVGATGAALVTGWTTGAETLGESVTAMGSTVGSTMSEFGAITADSFDLAAASTDALTVSVQELVGVIGSAAFAEASGSKGKAKSKSKAKPGAVGMTAEKADVPRKGKAGGAGMTATKADEPRNGKAGMVAGSEPGGFTEGFNAGDFVSSHASSLSMGAPVNSSRVSAPQQVSSGGGAARSGGGVPTTGGSSGGAGQGGGPAVAMYGTTIRETVDADIVTAKIGMVLDSRG